MMRRSIIQPLVLSICILPFGLLTPILEISPTHVFNPDWPGHARLHEVWQLIAHSTLALLCLWLAWYKGNVRLASLIALIVSASFLAAYAISPFYGGTMRHSDGSELNTGGFSSAVAIMIMATVGQVAVFVTATTQLRVKS